MLRYPRGVLDDVRPAVRNKPLRPSDDPIDRATVARVLAAVVESYYCMFASGFAPTIKINERCPVSAIDDKRLDAVMARLP
jgi:hypothetical protein